MNRSARLVHWLIYAALFAGGCASDNSETGREMYPSAQVNRPPKQAVEDIRRIVEAPPLSLAVTDVHDGTLVTGYQPFRGELHIVRYWEERTRYRITVTPDWNDPAGKSHIQVFDETDQRAEERQKWYPSPELHRPRRAAAVLKDILAQLPQR